MSRFDYVPWDAVSAAAQADFKQRFSELEGAVATLGDGRAKALVLTKLEEAYMWVGKAIRDSQVARATPPDSQ